MKAIALTRYLPIADPESLVDVELPLPQPGARDLLVRIEAISVNPVDTKVRSPKDKVEAAPKVLGWDAAGVVESVGSGVTLFKPGDEVYYAGDVTRPGTDAQFQAVDERLVGRKPTSFSFAQAAAMPLTLITAWEALYDRLGIDRTQSKGKSLLIIGGAGGVGSIAIQLAKLAGLTVIATASRPETQVWVKKQGADHVIDHHQPLPAQLAALDHKEVDYIANFSNTDSYWAVMAELIRPQGHIVAIVENAKPVEIGLLKSKSASFSWEFMFARALYKTPDMAQQGAILNEAAVLFETGKLRTTLTQTLSPINAENLRKAHTISESGKTIGKLALSGWK
ncbi:MAG TPA: zinc-binding alcohol dehydrogenase family protein [Candidatus Methylacidiphilales bacterium]